MNSVGPFVAVVSTFFGLWACAGDVYFGGHGETNWHWTGYSVVLESDGLTNWVAYTIDRSGKITKAPATFHRTHTNEWSAMFDEHVFTTNGRLIGLAGHKLVVLGVDSGRAITIQDGRDKIRLNKISAGGLKELEMETGRPNNTPEDIRR
jgi:hypothetical protein